MSNGIKTKHKSGKVALITGASSGIGKATAMAFAENGVSTVLADINEKEGAALANEIVRNYDVPSLFVVCDVSQPDQVKNLFAQTAKQFGRLDFAFNNAGIEGVSAPTGQCTEENWDRIISVNLKGVWLCMKYEIEQMLKQGEGAIVNCASVAGLVGFASSPAYTASKHGILGLTKSAALEYAKSGIRINAVCPGVIDTPMVKRFTDKNADAKKYLTSGEPIGRLGRPEEIADAVWWLCSKESSFVVGHGLAVDGGWVSQ